MQLQQGQVAVVTGGARGIGFALVEAFAARGLGVVVADRDLDAATDAAARLRSNGADALAVGVDVTDPAQVDALAAATLDRFGRVDVVCNNAGVIGPVAPLWEQDLRVWRWMLDVVLLGVVHGVRTFTPILAAQGSGHLLNTASAGGLSPLPGLAPYATAKGAVITLTENLRAELRRWAPGVGTTVLCPGNVATGLGATSAAARPFELPATAPDEATPNTLANRMVTLDASEVAAAALAAIEADSLYVFSHPDAGVPIRRQLERLDAALPPPPASSDLR